MANNRMWLLHRPSELAVLLGKRMAVGWYSPPTEQRLTEFYEHLGKTYGAENQDDFLLAMEDCSESSCFNDWKYGGEKEEGFIKLQILKQREGETT